MAYIGKSPGTGIRNRFIYTATAGQTTFSGTDDHSRTLNYSDAEFVDVFLNGVKLDKSDYTATSGTSIVLDEGATVDDILEVLAFDIFSVFSGEFSQDVTVGGTLNANGNVDINGNELILDADGDTSITSDTDDQIDFKIGGTDRMQLFNNANKFSVGSTWEDNTATGMDAYQFGDYSGSASILLKSSSSSTGGVSFAENNSTRYGGVFYNHPSEYMQLWVNNGERIRIDNNGHVYLYNTYANTTGGSANVHIGTSGELFRSTSSQNYKNTITDATHGLTELLTLRPVTYKHNSTGDVVYGGLIAEEVHAAGLTEFVEYNDSDEPDALHYGNMVALCIKAIQDLNAKVATLETENATQATTIADFETRIAALEAN